MKRAVVVFLLINSCILSCYSQLQFGGIVVDADNIPIPNAVAILVNKSGAMVESSIIDTSGYFSFQQIDFRFETIKVSAFGYKTEEIKEAPENVVAKIVLYNLAIDLDEVVVTGKTNVVQKSDRLVFTMLNNHITKGNNTYELLKLTPLVQENNSKISIIGKESVSLYINGRKSNLTQEALQSYLQSLPADHIESIEVITNPGVIYSVSGNQGVINLILKKNEADGLKGSFRFEDSQSLKKNSQNGSVYLDYQKKKFNLTSSLFINNQRSFSENTTDYYFYNRNTWDRSENEIDAQYLYAGGNIRVDYNFSENHTIGALLDISHINSKSDSDNKTIYYSSLNASASDSIYQSYNKSSGPTNRLSVNLNYRAKLSEAGSVFSLDLDYLKNNKDQNIFNHFNRLPVDGLPDYVYEFDQKSKDGFNNYSAKAEYKHVFNNKHNLTGGVEFYRSTSGSDFYYTYLDDDQIIPDPTKNNRFNYDETFLSGYLSYNWIINDKIMGSVGIKVENADSKGLQKMTGERTKRNDFDLLPNFSVLYQPNTNNRLSYNLFSIAARPGYYSLNPFRFFINSNTYKEYNPNLKITNAYFHSIAYTLNRNYIFGLNYNYLKNVTNNFLIPVDNQYIKLINANYGTLHTISPSFTWITSLINDRLYNKITVTGSYRRDKGNVETVVVDNKAYSYNFSFYADFLISKASNWNLTFNGFYGSKLKLAHEDINASYNISLGAKKVFPQNISLNFGINNVLFHYDIRKKATSDYRYYIKNKYYFQTAYVNISIPFGNQKTKGAQYRRTSSFDTSTRLKE